MNSPTEIAMAEEFSDKWAQRGITLEIQKPVTEIVCLLHMIREGRDCPMELLFAYMIALSEEVVHIAKVSADEQQGISPE